MILIIQCIILCVIFTIIMLPPLYKDPLSCIMSYPTKIREKVENLDRYKGIIKVKEKSHLKRKIIACITIIIIMAIVAWFSDARTFKEAFYHIFVLLFSVNIYDLIVLDLILFCHSKRVILPGTEDMTYEYKNSIYHIKGAVIGTVISLLVAFISSLSIYFINLI